MTKSAWVDFFLIMSYYHINGLEFGLIGFRMAVIGDFVP
jgi:hypothetical protein